MKRYTTSIGFAPSQDNISVACKVASTPDGKFRVVLLRRTSVNAVSMPNIKKWSWDADKVVMWHHYDDLEWRDCMRRLQFKAGVEVRWLKRKFCEESMAEVGSAFRQARLDMPEENLAAILAACWPWWNGMYPMFRRACDVKAFSRALKRRMTSI